MNALGLPSRQNRSTPANAAMISGATQPQRPSSGIGRTSRSRTARFDRVINTPPPYGGHMGELMGDEAGVLMLAGTPTGAPSDASPRLREALASADIVAAEDTRRLRRLVRDLG